MHFSGEVIEADDRTRLQLISYYLIKRNSLVQSPDTLLISRLSEIDD